jgi:RNA polymerase sigma-70 factor (ECF subfamily)
MPAPELLHAVAIAEVPVGALMLSFPTRRGEAATRRREFDAEAVPHLPDLYRVAMRLTRDATRAEDAVQEAFLQAWKSFDRFEQGTNCRAWLFRILFHCVNHQNRKWYRFPLLSRGPDTDAEDPVDNLASAEPVPSSLSDGDILAALDDLPKDYRAAVLLVDVEEFSYKEAAEILSIPIGTVMSRLSRARKLLRAQLAETARAYGILKGASGAAHEA